MLASLEPTPQVTRQLTALMTMVTLRSVTDALETELASTEFVVLPIFGRDEASRSIKSRSISAARPI